MSAKKYVAFFFLAEFFGSAVAQTDGMLCEIVVTPSLWGDVLKGLPSAFVALIAVWIALHQYLVAKAKLKFDLFEKRLAVFNIAQEYLPQVLNPGLTLSEINAFYRSIRVADFYFGKEIVEYLSEINQKAIQAYTIGLHLKANRDIMPPEDIKAHTELTQWVSDELQERLKHRFSKYLNFENWH